jgi:hypothetical protein
MIIDRRLLAGAMGLALVVAACGGSAATATPGQAGATTAPTQAAATQAAASEEPTEAATEETSSEPGATDDGPSLAPGAASDLEAMLPDEAGGMKFTKSSFDGSSLGFAGAGISTAELDPILKANGKTIADVRVAIAGPADTSGTETAVVLAFQVRGLDATKFLGATGVNSSDMTNATIGGKKVLQAGAGAFSVIVYTKDDVLFEILLASPKVAEDVVRQLP